MSPKIRQQNNVANFFLFSSPLPPLSKILVAPLAMMLACRVNSDMTNSYRLQANILE